MQGDIPLAWQIPADTTYWEHIAGFTSDDWQEHIAYLWLVDPIHDKRIAKGTTSIDKYSRPHDLQTIKEDHGSGGYRIDFVRIARTGNAQKRIHQEYFNIFDMKYPPRLPYGEWLSYPENKKWEWCAPLLMKDLNDAKALAASPAQQASAAVEGTAMFNTILQGVRTLRGESGENEGLAAAVLQMISASNERMMEMSDPIKQMGTIQSLIEKLAPKNNTEPYTLIITMLSEDLKAQRKEMSELRSQLLTANQPKDFIAQIIDNAPRLKEVAGFFGFAAGKGASGTDWGTVIAQTVDKLSEHVPTFFEAWKLNKATAGQPAAADHVPFRPGVVTNKPNQVAAPAAAPSTSSPAPTVSAEGGAAPPPPVADDATEAERIDAAKKKMAWANNKYGSLLKTVAPHLVDNFRAGLTGYDFRDWLIDRHGRNNWTALRDEVGAETMCQLAMSHPMLRAALSPAGEEQPGAKLYVFLQEVFTNPGDENAERLRPLNTEEEDPDQETDIKLNAADIDEARKPAA